MPKKAAAKKAAAKSATTNKRKKPEEDEVEEEVKEEPKKRKVAAPKGKAGKKKKEEVEEEEEVEEDVKAKPEKKDTKGKGKAKEDEADEEMEDKKEEGEIKAVLDKRITEYSGTEYLVSYGKAKPNEWVQLSETEVPVPLLRAFENTNKERLWKKLEALDDANPTEKLIYTHKCCASCAHFGIYSAAENGNLAAIKAHVANFPDILKSGDINNALAVAIRKNYLDIVEYFLAARYLTAAPEDEGLNNGKAKVQELSSLPVPVPKGLTPECLKLLCKIPNLDLVDVAIQLYSQGNRLTLASLLQTLQLNDKQEGATHFKNITDLHIAALTATKPESLPKPLDYEHIHANAFGKHITPLHLAALNPNPTIISALVSAGGDLTYADDYKNIPAFYATISDVHGSKEAIQDDEKAADSTKEDKIDETAMEIERVSTWQAVAIRQRLKDLDLDTKGTKDVLLERLISAIKKGKAILFDYNKLIHEEAKAQSHGPAFPAGTSKTFKWLIENNGFETLHFTKVFSKALEHECIAHAQVAARLEGGTYNSFYLTSFASKSGKALTLFLKKLTFSLQANNQAIYTALDAAVAARDVANVRRLLTFCGGSELKIELLEKAISNKALAIVELLVNEYKMAVNDAELYHSLLHTAVSHGFLDAAKLLIEKGANINEITDNGETVLMSAARSKHPACIQLLVEKGVDVNPKKEDKSEKEAKKEEKEDDSDATDFSIPVFHNMVFVISGAFSRSMSYFYHILKANGAECPSSITKNITHLLLGATATTEYGGTTGKGSKKYREAMARKPTVVTEEWVLEQIEKRNAEYRRKFGSGERDVTGNILHDLFQHNLNATHVGLAETVEYLISVGVDLNVLDNSSHTVLHSLILYISDTKPGGVEALKALLKHVTKDPKYINLKDERGYNAVLIAAALRKYEFLSCLMQQKGVALNEIIPIPPPLTKEEEEAKQKKREEKRKNAKPNSYWSHQKRDDSGYAQRKSVNQFKTQHYGSTLLHILCGQGNRDMIDKAIQAGADPNIASVSSKNTHKPLLIQAVQSWQLPIVEFLVGLPAVDINARDEETGNTVLHYLAASDGSVASFFDSLLEKPKGAKFDLGAKSKQGHTLLHSAINPRYSPALVRYLVKLLKADQELLDNAFRYALMQNLQDICIYLLDSGAKIQDLQKIIEDKSTRLNHVFFYVMHSPKLDPIDACTSSIAAQDNTLALKFLENPAVKSALTPPVCGSLLRSLFLHPTAQITNLDDLKDTRTVVDKLISLHPSLDVIKAQDGEGNTALHIAIKNKAHITLVRKLLDSIAGKQKEVIAQVNKRSQNCIHMAMYNRDAALLEELLKADCSGVNAVDGDGKTPIQHVLTESPWGIYIRAIKLVEVLVKGGADIFTASKGSAHGSAVAIASAYPPAISKPLCDALIKVIREINGKDAAVVEAKITAAFEEGNKTRIADGKKTEAARNKKAAERKKRMAQLKAIKEKSAAGEKKALQKQGSTQVMASLSTDKLHIPALGHDTDYEVYRDGSEIFDATLISTDIEYNIFGSNKYFHVQLQVYTAQPEVTMKGKILPSKEAPYRLYTSTARIGDYSPQENITKYYKLEDGISEFKDIFYTKTHNSWQKRDDFAKVKGAWNMMKKVYDVVIDEETRKKDYDASKLPVSVKSLLYHITDLSLLRRTMEEAGIDWRMMPLGRLDKSQLVDGHEILRKLEQTLDRIAAIGQMRGKKQAEHMKERNKLSEQIIQLSNEFYMRIPHHFYGGAGANHWGYTRPVPLDEKEKIKQKVLMLESLREVGAALELLYAPPAYVPGQGSLLDGIYDSLCVDITELPENSPQAELLASYVHKSVPEIRIMNLFKVSRWAEQESFSPWKDFRNTPTSAGLPSNMLLFHGTKATNVLGILSQGLKIAPPEAPTTGYMFGKGVYAANTFIKSRGYCDSHTDEYLMFVCETCVGETYDCTHSEEITTLPPGKHSTWGQGRTTPDPSQVLVTHKGVGVPLGNLAKSNKDNLHLNYDEFIVYDQTQIRLKYIIKFKN